MICSVHSFSHNRRMSADLSSSVNTPWPARNAGNLSERARAHSSTCDGDTGAATAGRDTSRLMRSVVMSGHAQSDEMMVLSASIWRSSER